MPAVLDTPECIEHIAYIETPTIRAERPQARGAHLGFWRTLAHRITKQVTYMSYERYAPSCSPHRPFEAPMDRLAREYPSLSPLALSII